MKKNNQLWKKIIKKSKKRKILILMGFVSGGLITTTAIVLNDKLSKNDAKSQKNNYQSLISKIKDKDLIINKDVDTSTDAKILVAIKNQLKVENPLLKNENLSKITDNITSLVPGVKTKVVLTILIDNKSNTINIKVTRPLSDLESVEAVKNALKSLSSKEIQIIATSGTITNNKEAIFNDLNLLIKSSKIDLKGTNILIKEENTELTLKGVPFTILISKGVITEEISSKFIVKRVKNNFEKNKRKIALIKSKIKIKTFDIDKNVDTSNDAKTLLAIKNQLKVENPSLSDQDLLKIDDNITSLAPNKKTTVTLIISIGSQRDIVKISIERDYSDLESVDKTKYALEKNAPKEITISATSGTISDHKNLIVKALKKNYWFKVILGSFRLPNIAIREEDTELTLEGVPFTILISKGSITKEIVSMYIVKRSKNTQEINNDKVNAIKNKITNKDLIIAKNVDTSDDAKILTAIKNELKVENPSLTNEDLAKITDNINSLVPEKRTPITLTISAGAESDTTEIWVTRPLSDDESIDVVKNELENLVSKEIIISATSGTITDRKAAISNALNLLIKSSNIDLKGTIISIKNENSELTLNGVPFTILISKGSTTKEIVSTYIVKRSRTNQEINNDKINAIKNKIVNKDLRINKNVDTSDDAKILVAIKNELKTQNPLLNDEDLLNITDNITSLVPEVKTNVVLTFPIDIESNTIDIQVTKSLTDVQSINVIKNKIVNKDLIINKNVDTSDNAKILVAIKNQLKVENPSLSNEDLSKITDNITSLVPGKTTPVILTISVGTKSNKINIKVTKSSNDFESVNVLKNAFDSLTPKEIKISATSGTITDNKEAIINALYKFLIRYSNLNLIEATISIKEEDTELTLSGTPFTILLSKGNVTQEITNWKVKKSKTIQETNDAKITAIKNKIVNKNLTIDKNVDTSDDAKILWAIKSQLRVQNNSLNLEDISKIDDNITALVPNKITPVILTISVGEQSDNIKIQVTRPLSDLESVNDVKNTLAGFSQKIIVKVTSGTITDNKEVILDTFNSLIKLLNFDLKGTNIAIKEENTELTLRGVPFTILISKGSTTQEIISKFIVARIESIQEIKNKIIDKELIINKDVDTSDDAKILLAIKNQLKIENPLLNNDNLLKITDNINSLVPGVKTNVILRILIGTQSDTINIKVTKSSDDFESVVAVKNQLENLSQKIISINTTSGTITDNKQAILNALKLLINYLKVDLKGTSIAIKEENTQLTSGRTPFTILISKGIVNQEIVSKFTVIRFKSNQERDRNLINIIKNKIVNKDLIIDKNVDPINDAKILAGIKLQLKVQNPALNNRDLSKITDNVSYLHPGVKTDVVLTISIGTQSDTIDIKVTKPACTPSNRCDYNSDD